LIAQPIHRRVGSFYHHARLSVAGDDVAIPRQLSADQGEGGPAAQVDAVAQVASRRRPASVSADVIPLYLVGQEGVVASAKDGHAVAAVARYEVPTLIKAHPYPTLIKAHPYVVGARLDAHPIAAVVDDLAATDEVVVGVLGEVHAVQWPAAHGQTRQQDVVARHCEAARTR